MLKHILLHGSIEALLLLFGLESSVSKLGGRVNKLESYVLECGSFGVDKKRFTQGNDSFADSWAAAFDHEPVLVDASIMWEATERSD